MIYSLLKRSIRVHLHHGEVLAQQSFALLFVDLHGSDLEQRSDALELLIVAGIG